MEFQQHKIATYILYDTRIENIFLSAYMLKAPEHCLKAYLLGQMYAQLGQPCDDGAMARTLGITPSMLSDCWRYWEEEGLIVRRMENGTGCIEFLSLREQAFGNAPAQKEPQPEAPLLTDRAAKELYGKIEAITGTVLQAREVEEISSWVLNLGMPPQIITACYEYCKKRGKLSFRYVGSVLRDWHSKGLTDEESLSEYLADMDRHYDLYRRVFRAMGFQNNPTEEQKRIMDSWTETMGFSIDRILEACSRSAGISNPNIKYVDAVLHGWYEEEHKTAEKAAPATDLVRLVQDSYEKDRRSNEERSRQLHLEINSRLPRVAAILDELRKASFDLSMTLISGKSPSQADALRAKIKVLNNERAALLEAAGYDKNATDHIYTCRKCKDTGLLDDGSRCSCFYEKLKLAENGLLK
ncbi:MAG: DnaD domain protein [Firmicutes bacterium]|nr:DnaD domain protein [Bacillota bacterium]